MGDRRPDPLHGKSQEAIGFLRNTGTDSPREAIGPKGSKLLLSVGSYGPLWLKKSIKRCQNTFWDLHIHYKELHALEGFHDSYPIPRGIFHEYLLFGLKVQ